MRTQVSDNAPNAVIQGEKTGCGIAACAALANVSYAEAKRIANGPGIKADDPALWSDTGYVRRQLSAFRIETASMEAPFTSWDALPGKALPAIKWHPEQGLAFNVVWDFGRMETQWFIGVIE